MPFQSQLEDLEHRVSDPRQRGVVIRGPFGVGKTELLNDFVRAERLRNMTVFEGAGTEVAQSEPFGALAHLVPDLDPEDDPVQVLKMGHRVLTNGGSGRRPLLVVEDAHLLDDWSAAFVHQAALGDIVFLVATIQTGKPIPHDISALLTAPGFTVTEMRALSDLEAAALIRRVLDGPVDTFAMTRLIRLSGGNPAWLRRLLADAQRRGTLEKKDGIWQRNGPLANQAVASAIADEFLGSLSEEEVEVLDLLALARSLELGQIEKMVDLGTLEHLENAGFVHVDPICPTSRTSLASNSVGELLRRRMSASRRIRLSRLLAATVRPSDADQAQSGGIPPAWLLEAGDLEDPAQYERVARLALANGDFALADRYATASIRDGGGETASVLRAEALAGLGRLEEANRILTAVVATATEDAHIAQAALAQMRHARYYAGKHLDATAIGQQTLRKLESVEWRDGISAELALHAGLDGDYTRAAEFGATVLERPGATDRAIVDAAIVSSHSLVMLGRLDEALAAVRRGTPFAAALAVELPTAQELLDFAEFQAHLWSGNLSTAQEFSNTLLADALDRQVPGWVGLWTLASASVKLFSGRVVEAAQEFCAALGHLSSFDPLRVVPAGTAWRALAEAQAGMLRAAEATIARIPPEYLPGEFRLRALQQGVNAWLMAQGSDTAGAAKLSRETGLQLVEHTHVAWGAFFLHHAARFGHGAIVADDLAALADRVDGELIATMSAHARALSENDAEKMHAVSASFAQMGCALLAAEAAAQAATILGRRNHHQAAARASARAASLADAAEGADTPALRRLETFLTPREQGIARMAMRGLSSREIAQALSISPRTVDNHLSAVYTKLGIHSRLELTAVIKGQA